MESGGPYAAGITRIVAFSVLKIYAYSWHRSAWSWGHAGRGMHESEADFGLTRIPLLGSVDETPSTRY